VVNCRRLVAEALRQMGRLDILVNNAGIQTHAGFVDASVEDFDRVMQVNLRAPFVLAQEFARHLHDSGRGERIINNSSVHEEPPFPNFTGYCACKGGLKMLMRNLAIELASLGITVNSVAPGAIETPINSALMNHPEKLAALLDNIPAQRLGQPRDVAGAVAFLASNDTSHMTETTLFVDGGLL
jgi:glucose 1-dehydrogenase